MSEEDIERLNKILSDAEDAGEEDHEFQSGLRLVGGGGHAALATVDDNSDLDQLPPQFLVELGKLIASGGMPYAEVEFSHTPPGGGNCRIYPDGKVDYPRLVWPRDSESR